MKHNLSLIAFLILSTLFNLNTSAQIIYVATDGTGDYNCNGISDQVEINQALDFIADNSDYTTVYLKNGHFIIDEPILVSSNTIFTGDSTSIIKLKENVAWWTFDKPLLTQKNRITWDPYGFPGEEVSNVEIYGFKIDAGLLQEEPSGSRYNLIIHFTYPNNITIHDMHFANGQWDAIRLTSQDTVHINCSIYNNVIEKCGHDAISFVGVIGFEAYGNEIYSTRTNSGLRATECDSINFHDNIIGNSLSRSSSGYAGIIFQNEIVPVTYGNVNNNLIYGKNGGIHIGSIVSDESYPTGMMQGVRLHHNNIYQTNDITTEGNELLLHGGIVVNGFQNTIIEHNIINGGTTDGIVYEGSAGGGTGYQTIVKNNIIINNGGFGISNNEPDHHTFLANNNLVYNNSGGNYNNVVAENDINSDPLLVSQNSTLNQWHHIVASYDEDSEVLRIYVDGEEKASEVAPNFGAIGSNNYNTYLGLYWGESIHTYFGKMDELAVWNYALSEDNISQLYNNGNPVDFTENLNSELQAYLKMENNWNDASGANFDMEQATAVFSSDAINGSFSGSFDGTTGVEYPVTLSTENGITISVWVNRNSLEGEIQTIFNKGKESDNDLIWLYFKQESVWLELGNGETRTSIEANILEPVDMDFHVQSEYGHWDGSSWVLDLETSPCVDGGYLSSPFENEPNPNGNRVNIGVYGNTDEASKSGFVSVEENISKSDLIFPNPTSGVINLPSHFLNSNFKLISIQGKLIKSGVLYSKNLNIASFETGVYFLEITKNDSNEIQVFKITKQ